MGQDDVLGSTRPLSHHHVQLLLAVVTQQHQPHPSSPEQQCPQFTGCRNGDIRFCQEQTGAIPRTLVEPTAPMFT